MDRKPKILIIDDDVDFVEVTSTVLKNQPYEVIVAFNGQEGLEKARKDKPDLVLLDILMPIMDGWSVAEHFKKDPVLSKIQVLALTSFSDSLGQPFEFDVSEQLKKPIKPKELLDVVEKYLKRTGSKA